MLNDFLDLCFLVGKYLIFYFGCKNNEMLLELSYFCLIYYVNSDLNIWEGVCF